MAFLSHSLKASGLDIKFSCAIQRVEKSGTPSLVPSLFFSSRSHRVCMTQGFIAQGVMSGKKSRESALMLHLDLLETIPAQTRQSFSLITLPSPGATQWDIQTIAITLETSCQEEQPGLQCSSFCWGSCHPSSARKQTAAKERRHDLPQHPVEATPHQLFGEEQF